MADRQHSIDYIINASEGSSFRSTFTRAQSEFTRLGKEIQNVQKIQRDISAYQRQEQAFQNTGAKLENLKRQYELLETQIKETREPTAELEREKLKLQQRIDDTALALERQQSKLGATEQRLKDAGISTDDLANADARLTGQIAELREEQDKAAQSAREYTETASSGLADVGQALASAGIVVGLKKIADAYADCIQTSAGFEGAMSRVAALSGASQSELEALSNKAKEMGAATQYTAQESAEAFGYMALAGWNAEQMLSGIAPVLDLAAASGMDLGQASDIVTDYLTAFGLGAGDAAKFVDQMAYAQAHSNTTTAALGEAYKNAAATAHSLGYSVEDTTAVLMAMANAGVKGGEAGSGLSTVMTRLATNTKNCDDELGKFGVRVYDENGKMRGLTDIIWDTARAFDGLSDQEQANLAKAIAGTNQYAKFQTILAGMSENAKAGGQSIADYADALDSCSGAAGKMADTMLDNLTGDLTRLDSAVDAVKISLGEQFTPELRELAQAGTEVLSGINRLIERNPAAVKGLTVFTGAMGLATAGVAAYSVAVKAAQALNLGSIFAAAGPFLAVAGAVSLTAGVFTALKSEMDENIAVADDLRRSVEGLDQALNEMTIPDIENEAQANAAAAESYLSKIEELGAVQNRTEEQELRYQGALAGLLEVAPELSGYISQTADEYGRVTYAVNGSTDAIRDNIEAMKQQAVLTGLQDRLGRVGAAHADAIVQIELGKINKAELEAQYGGVIAQRDAILNGMKEGSAPAWQYAAWNTELDQLNRKYGDVLTQYDAYNTAITDGGEAIKSAEAEMNAVNAAIDGVVKEMGSAAGEMDGASDAADSFAGSMADAAENAEAAAGPLDTVTERISKLSEAYAKAYEAALESVRGQYSLWDEAEKIESSSLDKIGQALDSQTANWTARLENLDLLSAYEGQIEGLSGLLDSLALDNSREGVNLLAGLADSVRQGDVKKLEEFAGKYTTLQEKQEEYAGKAAELKVDLETANEELLEAIDESIAGMERSHDAENAAHATIQAYIDEANNPDNLSAIRAAWGKAAGEAMRALNETHDPLSRGSVGGLTPTAILRYEGAHAEGGILTQPHIGLVAEDGPEAVIPLSASRRDRGAEIWREAGQRLGLLAADNASGAGAAWGGYANAPGFENGWTAVSLEDAMNAEPLEAMPLSAFSAAPVNMQIHIHLEAGAGKEVVDALDDLVRRGELQEAVCAAVVNMEQDKKRLAFA